MSDIEELAEDAPPIAAIDLPENESVRHDRKFIGHPRGVGALALGNFFNSFAWGGVYAILIYYLYAPYTQGLGFTQGQAATMIAAMGAGNSLFVIVGSWLSDRVLGLQRALIIGNVVKAIAFGCLAIPFSSLAEGRALAYLGLFLMALPIMGASNASLTGQLYQTEDSARRDAAFTINTVANSIAGLIAPVLIGTIGMKHYHLGFFICALVALLYGLVILVCKNRYFGTIGLKPIRPLSHDEAVRVGKVAALVGAVLVVAITLLLATHTLNFDSIINLLTTAAFVIPIIFLWKLMTNKQIAHSDRAKMKPFLKLFCTQVIVATSGVVIGTALPVFIQSKVQLTWFGISFAPATFSSIYAAFGLVIGALFVWLWTSTRASKLSTSNKFSGGIGVYAIGYLVLTIPVVLGITGKVNPIWVILFYLVITIGDTLVLPIGSSITAKLAPKSYETQMQSAWSQATSIANAITMVLFQFFVTPDQQMWLFPIMAVVLALTSLLLLKFRHSIESGME